MSISTEKRQPIAIVSLEWDVVDLIETCGGFSIIGFFEKSAAADTGEFRLLGPDEAWSGVRKEISDLKIALAIDAPEARSRLFAHYGSDATAPLRSPHSHVSPRSSVGHGTIVQRGAIVMPRARIGTACKLNVNATVHHDAQIGDFSTLAPGSQVLGGAVLGERVYLGAGAIVRQHCSIGSGAFIGAGAVVVADIPPGALVVGVPAKRRLR
jgi:sugar O-acyltransferase (sialic acid O-acetyltransferase NeuD family)